MSKKKNPKLELLNKIKEFKLNKLRNKIPSQINSNDTASNLNYNNQNNNYNSQYSLEIPFEFSRKFGDSNTSTSQFNSYISNKTYF